MVESKVITSAQHPLVKHLVQLRTDKKYREEHRSLLIEGVKLVQENPHILRILYTSSYLSAISSVEGEKWEISEAILHKISGMVSPEGVLAEVRMPSYSTLHGAKYVLAIDGVSEPGNLGVLLRTALAFGWDTIYFLPNGCDPFNEKVIRAARGAHFHLKFVCGESHQLEEWIKNNNVQSIVADLDGVYPEDIPPAAMRVLVVGNEAHGPSSRVKTFSQPVTIPIRKEMESLNVAVAGGILLYLFACSVPNHREKEVV